MKYESVKCEKYEKTKHGLQICDYRFAWFPDEPIEVGSTCESTPQKLFLQISMSIQTLHLE